MMHGRGSVMEVVTVGVDKRGMLEGDRVRLVPRWNVDFQTSSAQ